MCVQLYYSLEGSTRFDIYVVKLTVIAYTASSASLLFSLSNFSFVSGIFFLLSCSIWADSISILSCLGSLLGRSLPSLLSHYLRDHGHPTVSRLLQLIGGS